MRVPESVHPRLDRDGPGRGAIRRGIWHVPRLVAARRAAARRDRLPAPGCRTGRRGRRRRLPVPCDCIGARCRCDSPGFVRGFGHGSASSPLGQRGGLPAVPTIGGSSRSARIGSETAARYPGWSRRCARRAAARSPCRRVAAGRASPRTFSADGVCGTGTSGSTRACARRHRMQRYGPDHSKLPAGRSRVLDTSDHGTARIRRAPLMARIRTRGALTVASAAAVWRPWPARRSTRPGSAFGAEQHSGRVTGSVDSRLIGNDVNHHLARS